LASRPLETGRGVGNGRKRTTEQVRLHVLIRRKELPSRDALEIRFDFSEKKSVRKTIDDYKRSPSPEEGCLL